MSIKNYGNFKKIQEARLRRNVQSLVSNQLDNQKFIKIWLQWVGLK